MKAKEFLNQIKKIDRMIENKCIEKEQWKAIATSTTTHSFGERVQSSGNQQKMADAVTKFVDIDKEIDECMDKLIRVKKDVINAIEKLESVEYDLLHKVYIQNMTLYDVASAYDKSYTSITTVHGRALKNLQIILDERS